MTEEEIYLHVGSNIAPKYKAFKKLYALGYRDEFVTKELDRLDSEIQKNLSLLKNLKRGAN